MTVVVDANVWVSSLVPGDVFHANSRDWLRQMSAERQVLAAPAILLAEVAGAIARRTQRPADGQAATQALLKLSGLRLVAVDRRLAKAAAELAALAGLRGADAIYAALARLLSVPLVTWDDELHQRAAAWLVLQRPAGSSAAR